MEFASGLRLLDCPVHVHPNGREWVGLPGKPLLEDGRHKCDAGGKPLYVPIAEWSSRDRGDRFSEIIIAEIRARFPHALDGESPS